LEGDTDGDGISDYYEINMYKTNPNNKDTDGDGLEDYKEIVYQTNPNELDTDGDGIFDGEEIKQGLDPRFAGQNQSSPLGSYFVPQNGK
jgi:hypothetical protein